MDIQAALKDGYSQDEVMSELGRRTGMNYQQALKDGHAPEEVLGELNRRDTGKKVTSSPEETFNSMFPNTTPDIPKTSRAERMAQEADEVAPLPSHTELVRPALEMGGATGGALLGAAGGPATSIAGGGIGYAAGKLLADKLDEIAGIKKTPEMLERIAQTGKDFNIGALFQMGGEGAVAALQGVYKWAKGLGQGGIVISPEDILLKARDILKSNMGKGAPSTPNVAAAKKLAEEIPGYKPSFAEATADPDLIRFQQNLARQPSGMGAEVAHRQSNREVLANYLKSEFPGGATIDDVITQLQKNQAEVAGKTKAAETVAETAKGKLSPVGAQEAGREIPKQIEAARIPVKKEVTAMYEALPNEPIAPSNTQTAIDDLTKEFKPGDEGVFPSSAISRVKQALKIEEVSQPGTDILMGRPMTESKAVGFQDLHALRKDIGRQISNASMGNNPNRYELQRNLYKIKNAIDADIEASMGANNDYVAARNAYRDYADRFRSGAMGRITKPGKETSGLAIPDTLIAKQVFTPHGADDFIKAVGKQNASTYMEGYAANDLLEHAVNPYTKELNSKSLSSWLSKNKVVLDKYGITKNFSNLETAQATLDAAKQAEAAFGKSVAAKMLNSDPEKAMAAAFGGAEGVSAKNTGELMRRLVDQVKSSKEATQGLKNSFKDYMVKLTQNTADALTGGEIISNTKMQNILDKYDPAMKVLYGEKSTEYRALRNVQKAVEMSYRSIPSPLGGGSNTVEQANTALDTIAKVVGMPGLKMGGTASFMTRLAQRGLSVLNKMNASEINDLLRRAMYDPDLAQDLLLVKQGLKPEIASKKLSAKLVSMGIMGTTRGLSGRGGAEKQ